LQEKIPEGAFLAILIDPLKAGIADDAATCSELDGEGVAPSVSLLLLGEAQRKVARRVVKCFGSPG